VNTPVKKPLKQWPCERGFFCVVNTYLTKQFD
jgi:hypothetical protein